MAFNVLIYQLSSNSVCNRTAIYLMWFFCVDIRLVFCDLKAFTFRITK